ncbi:MAG: response regulator transcription factor [Actinomycetota bacterium]|nr:response regulator transcription factor [Actinomycetota bacterium]
MKILFVEDDTSFANALLISLRARGNEVKHVSTGKSAIVAFANAKFDVVILDLGLSDMDGTEVLKAIRSKANTPVLVLSARMGEVSKVEALDLGADDYVTKPFGFGEFLARLRAAHRRGSPGPINQILKIGELQFNLAQKEITSQAKPTPKLTPTEWSLLEVLALENSRIVPREELLRRVWGEAFINEYDYLRVYVSQLRRKLEVDPAEPAYLLTEPGIGYRLIAEVVG